MLSFFTMPKGAERRAPSPDRAGAFIIPARPVLSSAIRDAAARHGQSDPDIVPLGIEGEWAARTIAAAQRVQHIATRWQIAIAIAGIVGIVIPAICAAIAGGSPA